MKGIDYTIYVLCAMNVLEMGIELGYFKYNLDRGINLE